MNEPIIFPKINDVNVVLRNSGAKLTKMNYLHFTYRVDLKNKKKNKKSNLGTQFSKKVLAL